MSGTQVVRWPWLAPCAHTPAPMRPCSGAELSSGAVIGPHEACAALRAPPHPPWLSLLPPSLLGAGPRDEEMLEFLEEHRLPYELVLTKTDKLGKQRLFDARAPTGTGEGGAVREVWVGRGVDLHA